MPTYIAVVNQEPGSAFGIHFPDVPGCFSAADDLSSVPAVAQEALSLHLNGEPLPSARTLASLKDDPDVRADLAAGAFLIAVPLVRLTGRTTRANVTMDAGLLSAIDEVAKSRGLTRSAFLADLARREIGMA